MATPIILKITEAGKNAILDSENTGLTLRLSQLAIGSGQYAPTGNETTLQGEISRHGIVSGNVETQSHTLRFSSSITSDNEISVYEIGLMTEKNELFAVASTTGKPLLKVYPDITFVASFGLTLDEFDVSKITVVNDPNGALSIVLMQQHLASDDPHPQYAKKKGVTDLLAVLQQELAELKARPYEGIPVWGVLTTVHHYENGDEVTADLRYGKWARYAQGKVLAGFSLLATDIAEYKIMGNEFGENTETLSIEQMPSHNHPLNISTWQHGRDGSGDTRYAKYSDGDTYTASQVKSSDFNTVIGAVGGNQPHNNLQPAVVTAFWVRMPNDYTAPIFDMFWTTDSEGNNRIASTNEGEELYLWLTAQNLVQSMVIGMSIDTSDGLTIKDNANFTYPSAIGNGKHLLTHLPVDGYFVNSEIVFTMGVNMADGTALNAPIVIHDTVDNVPVTVGDSVFLFGFDHNANKAKLMKTQGGYEASIRDFTTVSNSGMNWLSGITIEFNKSINNNDLFLNEGWDFASEESFIWQSKYSGNPNIQGHNTIGIPIIIDLDSAGKVLTIKAKQSSDMIEMNYPFQLIIGSNITTIDNPTYSTAQTDRYDNANSPIQRPFLGISAWRTLVENAP